MSRMPSREEALFADALAQPATERGAFLAKACGADLELLARLIALVAAHEGAGNLLEVPAAAGLKVSGEESAGDVIAHYKLLQKIGEGGCGVVWMAGQEEPVRRRVALKVIKLGMDTKAVVARFEAERQALAMMDHPNIAKVLDAGSTSAGRPYFVMELVRGIPITSYCDENQLTPEERLQLFIMVCQAVQHAHQKGIIHRDLKPSNILVTVNDGVPTPKVIDFGIAKATQGRLTDATVFTAFEQFIGTPVYMSPEQAEMSSLDIDTRSDIYSLGVLLYELLTGRPPFDPKTLREAGIEEIRRIIREAEPVRPSLRLRTLGDGERDTVAKLRGTGFAQLSLMLRGDLDWIVLKALEKNRNRRYESATALGDDIARYLKDEPVLARPPSTAYLLRKIVRRNRVAFAAAAVVVVTLAASTLISAQQAFRATQAERAARLERGKVLAEQARAEKVIAYMIGGLRTQLAKLGRLDLIEGAANESLAYFTSIDPGEVDDATLARHAQALLAIGGLRMDQADYPKAQAAYAEAYARAAKLADRNPRNYEIVFTLARAEYLNGFVRWRRGEFTLAREWFVRQRKTAATLVALDPDNLSGRRYLIGAQRNLAALNLERGELSQAREAFLAELELLKEFSAANPEDPFPTQQAAVVSSFLGTTAERSGDLREAVRWFSDEVKLRQSALLADPGDTQLQFSLAESLFLHQAEILAIIGEYARAQDTLIRAGEMLERLVRHEPANYWWRLALFTVKLKQAAVAIAGGPRESADHYSAAARAAFENLTAEEPSDRRSKLRLARGWRFEAEQRLATSAVHAAAAAARAVELAEDALGVDNANLPETAECAQARILAGRVAAAKGDADAARAHWRRADELLAPLITGSRNWRVLDPAARVATLLGRPDEARGYRAQLSQLGYVPLQSWP